MPDIHKYQQRVDRRIEKIKHMDLLPSNKELILKFADDCFAERLTAGRVYKHLYHLLKINAMLDKDFKEADIEDIKRVMRIVENSAYREHTKKDYRITIKKFYKWLNGGDECPKHVKWIKAGIKHNEKKLPEDMLTQEEIKQMVKAANCPRDKALIFLLYESGCRIGEMVSIRLKNISFDKYGALIKVSGKTGERLVRIIMATDYLRYWYENHPDRQNPDAPLWVSMSTNHRGLELHYPMIIKTIRKIARKAGIRKKVNPHNFRHSRATFLASKVTEMQLCQIFGWTLSSRMPATYVHMSAKEVDNALLRIHGIAEKEEDEHITCPRCKTENKLLAKYCSDCGQPFGLDVIQREEEEREKYDKLMDRMLEDDEVKQLLTKKLKGMRPS